MRAGTALLIALAVLGAGVAGALAMRSRNSASVWEQRAAVAESLAVQQSQRADSLSRAADRVATLAASRDTVIRWKTTRVVVVDSVSPPPPECEPNLAARDTLITTLQDQVRAREAEAMLRALAFVALRGSHDSLLSVVRSRPRPSAFHGPSLALGAFGGWCIDRPCVGIGVTLNVGGIRLIR